MEEREIPNNVFFEKYQAEKKIGEGSFGKIYKGVNISTKQKIALKFEKRDKNFSLLETEAYRMIYLKGEGVPEVFCYGNNKNFNILIIELLGKSLEEHFNQCNKKLSLGTVSKIGIEMKIKRIKYIHSMNHIHRDIKPDNFMTGIDQNEDNLYIIDFGLAKKYRSSKTQEHIKFKQHKRLTGTIRYASLNASRYYEQSRRDDLEAIVYVLIYLLNGQLPWQGLRINDGDDRYRKIYLKKRETTIKDLCKGIPLQFQLFVEYCRKLKFEEEPNYNYLTSILIEMVGATDVNVLSYDWSVKFKKTQSINNKNLLKNTNKFNKSFDITRQNKLNISGTGLDNSMVRQHDVSNDVVDEMNDKNSIIDIKNDTGKLPKKVNKKDSNCFIY